MKKSRTILFACTFLFAVTAMQAQALYQKGTLHLQKRKSQEAYIEINFEHSQRFQQGITYMTSDDYEKFTNRFNAI